MNHLRSGSRGFVVLATAALGAAGCNLYGTEPPPVRPAGADQPGAQLEQVRLKIGEVPPEVRCVRITAVGTGRTVVREIEATGGSTMTESLSGLPIGTVTFTGEAFASDCMGVTKSTVAPWASAPVETSIVVGRLATVELTMVRNGRAKVGVTFSDEAACTAVGAACRIGSECCSRRCVGSTCVATDAAAQD